MNPILSEPIDIDTPYGSLETYVGRFGEQNGTFLVGYHRGEKADPPIVRAQYGCAHATVFHSLSCDCGEQIDRSLTMVAQSKGPALFVYFKDHEAYGIGIFEKMALLRAERTEGKSYAQLVAEGKYRRPDDSILGVMPAVLEKLSLPKRIVLLTSNDAKRAAIVAAGIEVVECVPLTRGDIPELERWRS